MRTARRWSLAFAAGMASIWLPAAARGAGPTPGSVTANTLQLPSGPGSVRGLPSDPEFDPFSGQVTYQIPIEVPAFGESAQVALSYSGTTGNGPAGIGWRLHGIAIRRTTRLGVPSYTDADELELEGIPSGGGRLFPIGGGEYRVEGRGEEVRVVRVGDGWRVWEPDGTRYEIGSAAASRQADGTRVAAWWVDSATDVAGRAVRYSYVSSGGQIYLNQAIWGPADAYRVDLVYEPRLDVVVDYRLGFRVETGQRIDAIDVVSFGETLRRYEFSYDESFAVSRLEQVVQRGRDGQLALPTLTLTYSAPAGPVVQRVAGAGTWRLNAQGTSLVDVDADGAADLLQLEAQTIAYRRNRRGTFGQPVATTGLANVSLATSQFLDIDADTRVELVNAVGGWWQAFRLVGTAWQSLGNIPGTQGLPPPGAGRPVRFADIDGDEVTDIVTWTNDGIVVRRGQRSSFAAPAQRGRIGGTALPGEGSDFHDANGDGIADFVEFRPEYLLIYLGHGDGQFELAQTVFYPWAGESQVPPGDIRLGDLDRDGLMDLVTATLGHVTWYPGRPGFSFPSAIEVPEPGAFAEVVVTLADINGNGSEDVVWSASGGIWRLDLAGPTNAGMLERVDNGLGKVVSFAYESSHSLAVKDEDTAPWSERLPISIPVVVNERTALGAGETDRQVDYHVWDGFWDAEERQFGGFLASIVRTGGATPAETSEVRTIYRKGLGSQRALRGKPLNIQIRDGDGVLQTVEEQTWELRTLPGYPDTPELKLPVKTVAITQYREGETPRTTRIEHEHDALGRVVKTTNHGREDMTGDEAVETTVYADDAGLWVRNLPCSEEARAIDGTLVSHERHYYGDHEQELPLCSAGRGWKRRSEAYLAGESRWVTQSETEYDGLGNPVRLVEQGVTRLIDYDAMGLHPVAERLQLESGELTWNMEWDNVIGQPIASTDPDGQRTAISYDALARVTAVAMGEAPPHVLYQYDLTAPFPRVVTLLYDGPPESLSPFAGWTPDGNWREQIAVANGRGEVRYTATRLAADRWIIADYKERDPNSRVVFIGDPIEAGTVTLSARPAGMVGQTLAHDPLGRLIEQTLENGTRRVYTHLPFEHTVTTDGLGPVRTELDGLERVRATERDGAAGEVERVEATYDPVGRITELRLQGGQVVHTYVYDSLGRLIQAHDPDIGMRELEYDDNDRLVAAINGAGQTVSYAYDAAGRLTEERADDGSVFRYHYDEAREGEPARFLKSRLAWVEEPTGYVALGYDAFGHPIRHVRAIDGVRVEKTVRTSPSGLVLGYSHDDGFALDYAYDPAGRPVGAGSFWSVEEQDASGNVLRERFGNGLVQKYERDLLGLSTAITVERPDGTLVYDVGVTRNDWLAIETVTDRDGRGLDHTASFGYDPQGRLTSAILGAGGAAHTFGYSYDGLQNMTARQAAGPTVLPVLAGTYRYGERGHGPRQLTSVQPATGAAHTFDYDPAGRLRAHDGLSLTYDGLDQLVRVGGLGAGHGNVQYAYGYDGQRIKTVAPDGAVTYWFSDGASEQDGTREHLVTAGDQLIARVTGAGTAAVRPAGPAGLAGGPALGGLVLLVALVALVCAFLSSGRTRRLAAGAGAVLLAAGQLSCGAAATGRESAYVWQTNEVLYFHTGISPGPTLFTREDGSIAEERRFEPFGAPIESYRELDSGPVVGPVDFAANDHNSLAKRTDPATGWSYHGARWMDPATARWLTPDPPVKAPDPAFLERPWALHPYQYVEQSPIEFWDPDGENRRPRGHARRGRVSRFSEENYETWTARSHARARAWEARQRERARRVEQMWRDMLSQPHDSFTLRPGRGVTQLPIWTRDPASVKYIGHVTMRLQRMATRAADRVDSLGLQALQAGQAQAIRKALRRGEHGKAQRLWAMNRGSAIDRLVREQARKDPLTAGLWGASNNGADFWHPRLPRLWWDVTTQRGWKGHSIKYGEWGIHISTGVTSPVPGGTCVPRTGPD